MTPEASIAVQDGEPRARSCADPSPSASALPGPAELRSAHPLPAGVRSRVERARREIRDVIHGHDARRVVVVVGPCSIHDPDEALEYGRRLARAAERHEDALCLVMRTYFEKPRSRGGWKGFLHDPRLDGSDDMAEGLARARALLVELGSLGLACGAEVLDPLAAAFLEDALAWGCIGARTAESQVHRQLASGLPMPVGFKNTTDGDVTVAHDAMVSARRPHGYLGLGPDGRAAVRRSRGNPDVHLVLRGGGGVPNDDPETVAWAAARARREGLERPIWVDCSHGNSHKNHRLQGAVCRRVLEQLRGGHRVIGGIMLESFLEAGRQDWSPEAKPLEGVSITDACIDWRETEALLDEIAEAARA
ncbi:MAG: 3-deoxy-7-phosphoheptulonate synthase [Myxococcota bacterium]